MKNRRLKITDKSWWIGPIGHGKTGPTIQGFVVLFWGIGVPLYVLALIMTR